MPRASPENLGTNIPKALPSPAHQGTSIRRGLPCPSGWPWAHSRWGWPCRRWLSWPPGRTGTQAAPEGRQLLPYGYPHRNPAGLPFTLLPPRTPSVPPSRGHLPEDTFRHPEALLEPPAVNFTVWPCPQVSAPSSEQHPQGATPQALPREPPPHALTLTCAHARTLTPMLTPFTPTRRTLRPCSQANSRVVRPHTCTCPFYLDNGSRKAPR